MKERIKLGTKILSWLLVFSLVIGIGPLQAIAEAETEAQVTQQTYGEWTGVKPVNGNFEVGVEGQDVYGWSITSMNASAEIDTTNDWTNNYTLKTEVEDGNKVAAFSKTGTGYAAMTSQAFSVEGGAAYRLNYDYFTKAYEDSDADASTIDFNGICVIVQQFKADGTQSSWRRLSRISGAGQTASTEWDTMCYDFVADADATSAQIYIRIGGQANLIVTVLIDNVIIKNYEMFDVPNGDFKGTTNDTDGGRTDASILGPGGWTSNTINSSKEDIEDSQHGKHIASLVQDSEKGQVLKYAPVTARGYGSAIIQSPYIPASASAGFSIQYDLKITGTSNSYFWGTEYRIAYYNADKEVISYSKGSQINTPNNAWEAKTITGLTTPEGTAYIKVGFTFRASNSNNTMDNEVYIDNVSLTVDDATTLGWTKVSTKNSAVLDTEKTYADNYTISHQSTVGTDGFGAVQFIRKSSTGYAALAKQYSVTPGEVYRISFDYKMTDFTYGTNANGNEVKIFKLKAFVIQYDSTGTVVQTDRLYDVNEEVQTGEITSWTQYPVYQITAAENTAYCVVYLRTGGYGANTAFTLWVDNLILEPAIDATATQEDLAKTDLLFVMLKGGNATGDAEGVVDVCDLVRMKSELAGKNDDTKKTDVSADMNKNSKYDIDDIQLLRWKLVGICTMDDL